MLDNVGVFCAEEVRGIAWFCILDALTIYRCDVYIGDILRFCWEHVFEFVKDFSEVVWHRQDDFVVDEDPIQGDDDVQFGLTVGCNLIFGAVGTEKILLVLFGGVLDRKVVYH